MRLIPSNSRAVDPFNRVPDPAGILDGDQAPAVILAVDPDPNPDVGKAYEDASYRLILFVLKIRIKGYWIQLVLLIWIRLLLLHTFKYKTKIDFHKFQYCGLQMIGIRIQLSFLMWIRILLKQKSGKLEPLTRRG